MNITLMELILGKSLELLTLRKLTGLWDWLTKPWSLPLGCPSQLCPWQQSTLLSQTVFLQPTIAPSPLSLLRETER